jgi:2-oxoisovalerate dehydrogenase E1 component
MTTVMAEMYGKAEGCSRRARRVDAPVRRRDGILWRQCHRRRRPAAGRRAGAGRQDAGEDRVTACFFGDGRGGRGRVPRDAEPCRAVGLPVLFVCENNGYAMGTASRARIRDRHPRQGRRLQHRPPKRSTAWTWSPSRPPRAGRWPRSARPARPFFLECNTYRFRAHSMFDAQLYRDKDEIATWREQGPIVRFQGWLLENNLIHEETSPRSRPRRCRDRGGRRLRRGRHLGAGRGPDEPCSRAHSPRRPCRALGRNGRDDLSRGGQAGDPRRDDPR